MGQTSSDHVVLSRHRRHLSTNISSPRRGEILCWGQLPQRCTSPVPKIMVPSQFGEGGGLSPCILGPLLSPAGNQQSQKSTCHRLRKILLSWILLCSILLVALVSVQLLLSFLSIFPLPNERACQNQKAYPLFL